MMTTGTSKDARQPYSCRRPPAVCWGRTAVLSSIDAIQKPGMVLLLCVSVCCRPLCLSACLALSRRRQPTAVVSAYIYTPSLLMKLRIGGASLCHSLLYLSLSHTHTSLLLAHRLKFRVGLGGRPGPSFCRFRAGCYCCSVELDGSGPRFSQGMRNTHRG